MRLAPRAGSTIEEFLDNVTRRGLVGPPPGLHEQNFLRTDSLADSRLSAVLGAARHRNLTESERPAVRIILTLDLGRESHLRHKNRPASDNPSNVHLKVYYTRVFAACPVRQTPEMNGKSSGHHR